MFNRPILPVTKNLLLINAVVFLFTYPILGEVSAFEGLFGLARETLAVYYPLNNPRFEPYQVVTSMFMHGDFWHLAFNMYGLWMFGSIVESRLGPQRYLVFYLLCGLGAVVAHWIATAMLGEPINIPMLGASGAIYGVLVGFAYIAPNAVLQLIIPPIPLKAKYFVAILIAIDLWSGFSRYSSGVAHFAHLGGALMGFILLTIWARSGLDRA